MESAGERHPVCEGGKEIPHHSTGNCAHWFHIDGTNHCYLRATKCICKAGQTQVTLRLAQFWEDWAFPDCSWLMSLACRTIDSLFQELAEEGLLIPVKNVNLSDYIGKVPLLQQTWCLIKPPAIPPSLTPVSSQGWLQESLHFEYLKPGMQIQSESAGCSGPFTSPPEPRSCLQSWYLTPALNVCGCPNHSDVEPEHPLRSPCQAVARQCKSNRAGVIIHAE